MRELTKSALRFSWSMSLLGVKGMTDLLSFRKKTTDNGGLQSVFDSATRCAVDKLGDTWRDLFRTSDQLQQGIVDAMFRVITLDGLGSGRCGGAHRPGCGEAAAGSPPPGSSGWGPMPSNRL